MDSPGLRVPLDEADLFIHRAVRAYATGRPSPRPPAGREWLARGATAGVLSPLLAAADRAGHPLPEAVGLARAGLVARQLRTAADLRRLTGLLDDAALAHAVLKGPVLDTVVFAEPNVRDYTDLDLLVSPGDLRRVVSLLLADGAVLLPADWAHALGARTAELALTLPHGTVLDLHCHLLNRGRVRDGFPISTDLLLARRVRRGLDGVRTTTLDDLDLTVHVLLHACLSGGTQLRWLLDVQQCTRWLTRTPGALADRAGELGATLAARAVLDSAATHVDPDVARWAEAMGEPTTWTRALVRMTERRPPSSPSAGRRSARTWYGATRATSRRSWCSAASALGRAVRYQWGSWPEPRLAPADPRDPAFLAWLESAEAIS